MHNIIYNFYFDKKKLSNINSKSNDYNNLSDKLISCVHITFTKIIILRSNRYKNILYIVFIINPLMQIYFTNICSFIFHCQGILFSPF